MLNPAELLEIQAETLFRCDPAGRLLCVNEPGDRPAPRVYIATAASGERLLRVRGDIDATVHERLQRCTNDDDVLACIERAETIHRGPAFVFDETVDPPGDVVPVTDPLRLHPALASWTVDIKRGTPLFGIERDGQVVSICYSSREGDRACEAGVETAPDYRSRGLARQAVLGWAATVQRSGRIALYSTTHENLASRRLAASLHLRYFAENWSID